MFLIYRISHTAWATKCTFYFSK